MPTSARFAADGKSFIYPDPSKRPVSLWIKPIAGSAPRQIGRPIGDIVFNGVVSREGRIAISHGTLTSDLVLITMPMTKVPLETATQHSRFVPTRPRTIIGRGARGPARVFPHRRARDCRGVPAPVPHADGASCRAGPSAAARRPRILVDGVDLLGTGRVLPVRQPGLERDDVPARDTGAAAAARLRQRLSRRRARSEL